MRFFLALLLSTGLGLSAAHAQTAVSFGLRAGGGLASGTFTAADQLSVGSPDYAYNRRAVAGYQLGVVASIGSGHLIFQPALVFSLKGLQQDASASGTSGGSQVQETLSLTSRVNYVELPLNVVYSLGRAGQGLQLFAGPYLACGVGGQARYTAALHATGPGGPYDYSESGQLPFAFGDTFVDPDPNGTSPATVVADARARRFDAGLNAGVGYRSSPLQAQLGYGLGLLSVQPGYPASYQ